MMKENHGKGQKHKWHQRALSVLAAAILLTGTLSSGLSEMPVAAEENQTHSATEAVTSDTSSNGSVSNNSASSGETSSADKKTAQTNSAKSVSGGVKKAPKKEDEESSEQSSLDVTVKPDDQPGTAVALSSAGTDYTGTRRGIQFEMDIHAVFPNTESDKNKRIEINLPYGMCWSYNSYYSPSYSNYELVQSKNWYKELKGYYVGADGQGKIDKIPGTGLIDPYRQTDGSKKGISNFKEVDGGKLYNGTVTLNFNEGVKEVTVVLYCSTAEKFSSLGETGLERIDKAIDVTCSYDGGTTREAWMNLNRQPSSMYIAKADSNQIFHDLPKDGDFLIIPEDGVCNGYNAWLAATQETALASEYSILLKVPEHIVYKGVRNAPGANNIFVDYTPRVYKNGESVPLSDGTTYTVAAGEEVYEFTVSGDQRVRQSWSIWSTFYPVWQFPKEYFKVGQTYNISFLDVRLKYYRASDYVQYDRTTLPSQNYRIAERIPEVFVNVAYDNKAFREGYFDSNQYQIVYLGAPGFEYTQENKIEYFDLGNRGTGDAENQIIHFKYDLNNTGMAGITEQVLYRYNNDANYGTTKISNLKVKLWNPKTGAVTDWISIPNDPGNSLNVSDVPEYKDSYQGWYFKEISYQVDKIPAQSSMAGKLIFYGRTLKDDELDTVWNNNQGYYSTLTVENANGAVEVTGRSFTKFGGKMKIDPVSYGDAGSFKNTVKLGEKINVTYPEFIFSNGNAAILDSIYLISPYGDRYSDIKMQYLHTSGQGYYKGDFPQPKITEIDSNYPEGNGTFQPTEAFTNKYPYARVYKLDFTGITDRQEIYNTRQAGGNVHTDKSYAREPLSKKEWDNFAKISFTFTPSKTDKVGWTDNDLLWVQTVTPDDQSSYVTGGGRDIYNLSGNLNSIMMHEQKTNFVGDEDIAVVSSAKMSTDNDSQYRTWSGTKDDYDTYVGANNDIDYKLTISNTSSNPAQGLTIYVPVPKKGQDWGDNFQQDGAFNYSMNLESEVKVPEGFTVSYASVDPGAISASDAAWSQYNWEETPSDFSKVNFIRISSNAGTVIPSNYRADCTFKLKASDFTDEDIANNVTDIWRPYYLRSLTGVSGYKAGEPVAVMLTPGYIGGTLWEDNNKNGYIDSYESKLADREVNLYRIDADGTETLASTQKTNTDGQYKFTGLLPGQKFSVKIGKEDGRIFTIKPSDYQTSTNAMQFDADENDDSRVSRTFTIASATGSGDSGNKYAYDNMNCGMLQNVRIFAKVVWEDDNNDALKLRTDMSLKMYNGENALDGYDPQILSKTTAEYAQLLDSLPVTDGKGNGIAYTFRSDPLYGYETTIQKDNQSTAADLYFTITNRMKKVDITIKKIDSRTSAPLSGAEFTLCREGTSEPPVGVTGIENGVVAVGSDGTAEIQNLPAGTYTLTETKAPKGYKLLDQGITFTVGNVTANGTEEDGMTLSEGFSSDNASVVNRLELDVKNTAGIALPVTGGAGTAVFYIFGGLFAAGAVALMIIRRRRHV